MKTSLNFTQLLRKVLKLLSDRRHLLFLLIILLLIFSGCGSNNEQNVNFDDKGSIRKLASQLIEENIRFVSAGYFTSESGKSIVAGFDTSEKNKIGISFSLIDKVDDEFQVIYNTGLLEGSFDDCIVDKMKFSSEKGELIYYDSREFYIGSGGGDVFLYLVNMLKRDIYYAHLIVNRTSGTSLFLSDNIADPLLRKFFVSYFKKDYSNLRLINSDIL